MSALDDMMKSAPPPGDDGDDVATARTGRVALARPRSPDRIVDPLWFKDAIIYQLHVKAFFDAANAGDFKEAASCLRDAITLADGDDEPVSEAEPEPMHHAALLLMPKGKH